MKTALRRGMTSAEERGAGGFAGLRRWFLAAGALCVLVLVAAVAPASADDDDDDGAGEFETGEIVVKLDPRSGATVDGINQQYGTTTKETFLPSAGIYLLDAAQSGRSVEALVEEMARDARLVYAEPNYIVESPAGDRWRFKGRTDFAPEPSEQARYTDQYAVGKMGLREAHGVTRGAGATVAVLDTGVQGDHPELAGSLVPGYNFLDDNTDTDDVRTGADDDGDGVADELAGHGTHVAGIVHLTAPEAKIMPMRVLDSNGTGNVFLIAEAIQEAVRRDADVINLSLSSTAESDFLEDVLEDVTEPEDDDDDVPSVEGVPPQGLVVVGSAGNEGEPNRRYPASEDGVLGVASVGSTEVRSDFSNYGREWVDVAAPGEEIQSLFPTGGYASWDGTSMSAPFVSGQAALIRAQRPNLPVVMDDDDDPPSASVEGVIKSTARPLADRELGAGHADAARSLGVASQRAANLAPTVAPVSPKPNARTKSRTPTVVATVRDPDSRLAKSNVRLFVKGKRYTNFTYNASTGRLSFKSPRLPYGPVSVRVAATDAGGKSASRSWTFRIVR
ncbi:Subtilase family [Rubrobacter radiotolerans]|uniref:S8 family serine peptidase n=1 Tax=Rubrobacter radiotolerans TaxID=42256 RepID=A0A023X0I4_RUBRA|nr:S8 family serine peptidase [Rubrobacter radiotolerans]AHY45721.1 Subtilase family [Rubrobacter radiotolerans]MDX5893137.1 S8 family serine peptidase [Rubrobacter radiotolerans]SMC03124.1 Subtilase family protein [Rubrobacter radiotolerans DSM 5868]